MATYSLGTAGDISSINDFQKVQSYLYRMNEQLRYTFANLTLEDNFAQGSGSKLTFVSDGEKQASIESSLSGIILEYLGATGNESNLTLSDGVASLAGESIIFTGDVIINKNFKIDLDGAIEAVNGNFTGDVLGAIFNGSEFNGNKMNTYELNATNIYTEGGQFYVVDMSAGEQTRTDIGLAGFTIEGEVLRSKYFGTWTNPVKDDDANAAIDGETGYAGFRKLWVEGVSNDLSTEIANIWDAINNIDTGGDDGGSSGDGGYDNGHTIPDEGDVEGTTEGS